MEPDSVEGGDINGDKGGGGIPKIVTNVDKWGRGVKISVLAVT